VGGDTGESEIDGCVLRRALPERDEIGFGFVKAAGVVAVAQGAGEAELVLGVCRIAGQGGAEGGDRIVVPGNAGSGETPGKELASAGLLIGGEAGHEMADSGKSGGGGESEDQQENRRGARNQFGERPRHISSHDIISAEQRTRSRHKVNLEASFQVRYFVRKE